MLRLSAHPGSVHNFTRQASLIDPFQVDVMRQNQLWIVGAVVLVFLLACFTLDLDKIKIEPVDSVRETSMPVMIPQ
jgi:hypothetical protein